jgi:hypothetical protein
VYSDDGERVKFFTDCNLDGAVEIWLSRLLEFHCETIRNWLRVAVTAYEVCKLNIKDSKSPQK